MLRNSVNVAVGRLVITLALALATLGPPGLRVAGAGEAAGSVDANMARLLQSFIVQMGDSDPAVRENATALLKNLPLEAYPAVEQVLTTQKDLEPEVRARLNAFKDAMRSLAVVASRRKAAMEWNTRTLLETYDNYGVKNARWDAAVKQTLVLSAQAAATGRMPTELRSALDAGEKAKCSDQLFEYFDALYAPSGTDDEKKAQIALMEEAVQDLKNSDHPALRKCIAHARFALMLRQAGGLFEGKRWGDALGCARSALAFFERIRPEDEIPPQILNSVAELVQDAMCEALESEHDDAVIQAMQKMAPDSAFPLVLRAKQYLIGLSTHTHAFDQATKQWVVTGTSGEAGLDLLDEAYAKDPDDPRTAEMALSPKSLAQMTETTMEKWFQRAMKANPDNLAACRAKLDFFQSYKRDENAAMAFARDCVKTDNWRGGLPLLLVDCHLGAAAQAEDKLEYLRRPDVWQDMRSVYDRWTALYPHNLAARSSFAFAAMQCQQWREADRQFKILGDKPYLPVFVSMTAYNYQRKKAARLAGSPTPATQAAP